MKYLTLLLVLFAIGCAHNPNQVVAVEKDGETYYTDEHASEALAQGNEQEVICERRVITGSHRVTRVCTTKKQKNRDRQEAREYMERNTSFENKKLAKGRNN